MRGLRLITVLVVAGMVVALSGCDALGDRQAQDRTYEIQDKISELVLEGEAMRVEVVPDEGRVRIEETRRWRRTQPRTTRVVEGTTLRIKQTDCGGLGDDCEVRMTIYVPAATALDIDFGAGDLEVRNMTGNLKLNVNTGRVQGDDLSAADTLATVNVGQVRLNYLKAPTKVEARVNTGDVEVEVPDSNPYAVTARGNAVADTEVEVRQDPAAQHTITVSVDVGSAKVRNR